MKSMHNRLHFYLFTFPQGVFRQILFHKVTFFKHIARARVSFNLVWE